MYEYRAKTTKVVDGDTYDFDFDMGLNVHVHERVRLANGDTPEVYGRASKSEKEHGKIASTFMKSVLMDQEVVVRTGRVKEIKGKYGRWIGQIFIPFDQVSDMFNISAVDAEKYSHMHVDVGALLKAKNLIKWKKEKYNSIGVQKDIAKVNKNVTAQLAWKLVEGKLLKDLSQED